MHHDLEDISDLINPLNTAQREAVTAPLIPILVLAGAGTGKTRVLVHRIAWLIRTELARPHNILTLTFTNKAAAEMQARIGRLLNNTLSGLWTGTFHGIAHRLLRIHWQEANLPQAFQILDSDDQLRVLKRVIRALELDEKTWTPRQAQSFINECKDEGLRASHVMEDSQQKQLTMIYALYEETCQKTGVIDFAELLLRTYELLRDNVEILSHYRYRFQHILVDEFQDTNAIQYSLLRLLIDENNYLFAVGDDDQSIYSWRGARIENMQHFTHDFPKTRLIRLEQNYRSTQTILSVANKLIQNNKDRLGKELWTTGDKGNPIALYKAFTETDEATFVVNQIQQWQGQYRELAILYRTSAQSRIFEEQLLEKQIPYRIYGGLRFYERAEIKDLLAYLRLIVNNNNDDAFERIVNTPKRGIGEKTLELIRSQARRLGISLWQAAYHLINNAGFQNKAGHTVLAFLSHIEHLNQQINILPLPIQIKYLIEHSGLIEHYQKDTKVEVQRRLENLEELVTAAQQFIESGKDGLDPVTAFLAHATLESGEGQAGQFDDCVQLMTLHLAKGLEFQTVFLCGLEEGLFPHQNSIKEGKLEEERRLCYVGITRARQELFLSHAECRYQYGSRSYSRPSRFLNEMPRELIEEIRLRTATTPSYTFSPSSMSLRVGQIVKHEKYGEGIVMGLEGEGNLMRVQIQFHKTGLKWLVVAYARLEVID